MTVQPDNTTGTVTFTSGSPNFTTVGTNMITRGHLPGDRFLRNGLELQIDTILTENTGTLTENCPAAAAGAAVPVRLRYQPDGSRVAAQTRALVDLLGNGNLQAFAGLSGVANRIPMFSAPGVLTLVPKTDLITGAAYNVKVDTLAARATYDLQTTGFTVLVSNIGDGRSAIYAKASNANADWDAPAYVTGPVGPTPIFAVASTTTLAPGASATFTSTPNMAGTGYDLAVGIPAGRGAKYINTYSGATAYVLDDTVQDNGSSWILTVASSTGNAPPTLPATSNAYWKLLARRGVDGAGTVISVVAGSGIAVNNADPTNPVVSAPTLVGDTGSGGTKGIVPAPAAGDAAALKFLNADGTWKAIATAELERSVSIIALQAADNAGAAIFGYTWVADSFDALTYVDVAGATNLDTSEAGILKPKLTPATRSFRASYIDTTDTTTSTFTAADIGTAATDRIVVVAVAGIAAGGLVPSSVTIGGVTATLLKAQANGNYYSGIFAAAIPTGTTANVVVTWSNTALWTEIITWATYGASITPTASGSSVANPLTDTLVVPAGSVVFGISLDNNITTFTWTGLSEDSDNQPEASRTVSGASLQNATAQSLVITATAASSAGTSAAAFVALPSSGATSLNLAVRSAIFTAAAVPTQIKALIKVKETDPGVAGTDYTMKFSRNGGTNYATATLTELYSSPSPVAGVRVVEAAFTSVAGQPSGTSVCWKFETPTGKMIKLDDVKIDWI